MPATTHRRSSCPESDGTTHSLADYEGRTVILAWFPKRSPVVERPSASHCVNPATSFRRFDIAYFMISVDDVETNTKFAQSLDADFPLLSDPSKRVAEAYGVVNDERPVPFR